MEFDQVHRLWLDTHRNRRSGERKDRLDRGHGHGEQLFLRNVWWPLRGSLDNLHPEYEIADWRGRPYFADFAWLMSRFEVSGQCDLAKIALKSTLLQAVQLGKSIRPKDVESRLGVNHRTAVRYLQQLCQQGWLHAHSSGNSGRVLMYDVVRRDWDAFDW